MKGVWDRWNAVNVAEGKPHPYANTVTYELGARWLAPCALIEDWGCGGGWLTNFVPRSRYRGVDGSHTPFVDVVADLEEYTSEVPGVFMRHVLEHNYGWERILENACASFRERMALVLFTPLASETREIAFAEDPGVPDLSFALEDISRHFDGCDWRHETLRTPSQYGVETVFCVERG